MDSLRFWSIVNVKTKLNYGIGIVIDMVSSGSRGRENAVFGIL